MEEPKSPVLSCKRPTRLANLSSGSPVLSNGRKRKRRPTDSPVFLRSTPSVRNFNGRESPIIENFCSPPSSLCDRGPARKLRPKSLLFNVDEIPLILVSPSSPIIGQKTKDQLIEEDSQSEDSESEELVICEKTITDTEDSLDASLPHTLLTSTSFYVLRNHLFCPYIRLPPSPTARLLLANHQCHCPQGSLHQRER